MTGLIGCRRRPIRGGSYEQLGYDANGNVTSQRKRDGRTLTFGYDALNRMTSKTVPNARSVFYAYDLTGAMTEAHFDSLGGADYVKNAYNALGQVLTSTTSMGGSTRTLSYTYDAAGNRAQITHPDGTVFRYDYDDLGRLNHLKDGANNQLGLYVYLDNGKLTWRGQGANGTGYGYDALGRILSYNMQRLDGGSVTAVNTALSYNAASQIVQQTRNSDAYAYTDTRNVDRNFATNGLNQYTSVGPDTYSYDANGNLTSDGGNTYTYDAENRLTGVTGARSGSLVYDPIGRLWQTNGSGGVTQFLYDGDQLVAEYNNAGGLLRRYVQGTGNDDPLLWYEGASTSPYRLYTDHLGSVVGIIQDDGTMRQINTYDEYGVPGSGNLGRFQYTGQAWIPELGLYYYKARMYSPMLGRFMQTDPIGYGDGLNWYNYVGGDPINSIDPTGEQDEGSFTVFGPSGQSLNQFQYPDSINRDQKFDDAQLKLSRPAVVLDQQDSAAVLRELLESDGAGLKPVGFRPRGGLAGIAATLARQAISKALPKIPFPKNAAGLTQAEFGRLAGLTGKDQGFRNVTSQEITSTISRLKDAGITRGDVTGAADFYSYNAFKDIGNEAAAFRSVYLQSIARGW